MTPQLMQAIKLLQLSNLDLAAYVEGELERNPFLERASEGEPPTPERALDIAEPADGAADGQAGDWVNQDLETSRSNIEAKLDTDLENVFPDDAGAAAPRARPRTSSRRPIRNGRAPAAAGREDGDYNLEAFVSAELTLADHLAEQLALAIVRSGPPHDRAIPDRYGRRGRLSHRRSRGRRREARRAGRGDRGGARHRADLRSAGRVRAQSHRVPRHPAQGARSLRPGDAGAGRPSRSARQARPGGAAAALRRRRRGPHRDDRRDPRAQSQAGPRVRLDRGAADRARRVRAAGAGRRLHRRAQLGHVAEGSGQPESIMRSCRRTR